MNTGDIIMNKIKPWQSEEQYEKAVDFLENRHRNLWKEGTIAKSVSWSYIIKGRCFQFPRGAVEVPEEAKKISKKHPLPYIPKFFATQKDWKLFFEEFQKQIEAQQDEALKVIYPQINDSKIRLKRYRTRIKLIYISFALLTVILIGASVSPVIYVLFN